MRTAAYFYLCLLAYPGCVQLVPDPHWLRWWWKTGGIGELPAEVKERCDRNQGNLLIVRFLVLILICLVLSHQAGVSSKSLGFRWDQPSAALIVSLLAGLVLICWAYAMKALTSKAREAGSGPTRFLRQPTHKILLILILGGFAEELWRAVSLSISRQAGFSGLSAVLITSIIFGVGHVSSFKSLGSAAGRATGPAIVGIASAALFLWWQTLLIPWIAHVMLNSFAALSGRKRLVAAEALKARGSECRGG